MKARPLLFGLLAAVGVGCASRIQRAPTPRDVEAALVEIPGFLDEQIVPGWLADGVEPLRQVRDAIRSGSEAVRAVAPGDLRERVRAADVVLVGDLHTHDACRLAFVRLVEEWSDRDALRAGRVAMAFESVPDAMQAELDRLRSADATALGPFLGRCWPWPVQAYADLLARSALAHAPTLACGGRKVLASGPADAADSDREPGFEAITLEDFKYGETFCGKNWSTAARARSWVREDGAVGRRQVFVLYGAAHLWGNASQLRERMLAQGLTCVVLVPFLPEWELELRRRFGAPAASTHYDVASGVFRPALVTDIEIVATAARKRRAAAESR